MFTRFLWGLAGCLLVAALVATAGAQEKGQKGRGRGAGGPGFFGGGSLVMLAGNEAVQKEIGADAATVGKIKTISDESSQALQDAFAGGGNRQDLSDEERQKRREKFAELSKKSSAKLKEALTADQFKRLQQISWQAAGAAALADETLAKELAITEDQKKKLADVRDDYAQKRQALGRDAAPEARRELAQEESKKAIEVLTAEQQEKFTALKGKAFDVAALRGGFGGGRPGGKGKNRPKTE
jgi:hypothetical protein